MQCSAVVHYRLTGATNLSEALGINAGLYRN